MRKTANTENLPAADPLDADVERMRDVLKMLGKQQSLRDPIGGASAMYDLTPPQAHTVLALGHEGTLTMGELSRRCGITEKTITGVIDERGRLPGATAFATGRPEASTGRNEKSVSWLLRKKPPTARPEPNSDSTDVVIETTSPSASTTTK